MTVGNTNGTLCVVSMAICYMDRSIIIAFIQAKTIRAARRMRTRKRGNTRRIFMLLFALLVNGARQLSESVYYLR